MKMTLQIVSLLQAVLFCSITLFYSNSVNEESENYFSKTSSQAGYYSFSSRSFYLPVSSNQEFASNFNKIPTQTRTSQYFNFDFSTRITEFVLNNNSSDYLYYSLHLIHIRLNPPDIIYPFHDFW